MRVFGMVAAAALATVAAQANAAETAEPESIATQAPPPPPSNDPTPNPPEPTPQAAAARANPADAGQTGVIRYDPAFFADARPNTAMDMIDRIPGFSFDGGDDGVRGFAGAAGNVLVDGARPTAKQDNLENILRRIPASQVDHIDIIRGGAPGIDMQGKTILANVVRKNAGGATGLLAYSNNFITRDGRNRKAFRAEGTKRWADGRLLEGSFVVGQFVDDGAGDGPRVRVDGTGAVIERADVNTQGGGVQRIATAAYETPLAGGKFRINGSLLSQPYDYREEDQLLTAPDLRALRDQNERTEGEVGLRYERAFGGKANFEGLFIQQNRDESYRSHFNAPGDDELFYQENKSSETIGRATLRYRFNDKLSAEAGIEGALNVLDSDSSFTFNGADIPLPAGQVKVEEQRGELSGKVTWKPSTKYVLELGVRAETSTITSSGDVNLEKSLFYPKPRAVFTWSPNEQNQVRLRVEREVGQLDFGDFAANGSLSTGTVQVGNPDIVPAQAWVGEMAYERRFWKSGAVVLTYRHSEISDVIDRVPIFAIGDPTDPTDDLYFDAPGNIGDAKQDEVQLSLTLPLDKLGLKNGLIRGDGTWRHSEVLDPTTGEPRRISGQHPFDYEFHFSQDLPQWKSNWGVDVYNRWTETYFRFDEIATYKLKTYAVLFYEYKPRPDLSLRTELSNLGSRGFQRVIERYSGPRDISPLLFRDTRDLDFGPMLYFRIRKTFGG